MSCKPSGIHSENVVIRMSNGNRFRDLASSRRLKRILDFYISLRSPSADTGASLCHDGATSKNTGCFFQYSTRAVWPFSVGFLYFTEIWETVPMPGRSGSSNQSFSSFSISSCSHFSMKDSSSGCFFTVGGWGWSGSERLPERQSPF